MAKGILVVLTSPITADRDADFNRWYEDVHLPEVTSVPGIVSARRYRMSSAQLSPGSSLGSDDRYLAIYEIDSDDWERLAKEIPARGADGRFDMGDSIRMSPLPVTVMYEQI